MSWGRYHVTQALGCTGGDLVELLPELVAVEACDAEGKHFDPAKVTAFRRANVARFDRMRVLSEQMIEKYYRGRLPATVDWIAERGKKGAKLFRQGELRDALRAKGLDLPPMVPWRDHIEPEPRYWVQAVDRDKVKALRAELLELKRSRRVAIIELEGKIRDAVRGSRKP